MTDLFWALICCQLKEKQRINLLYDVKTATKIQAFLFLVFVSVAAMARADVQLVRALAYEWMENLVGDIAHAT